ncbi:hypothetical protein ACU4GD_18750 [Cupriavidus basilensis]
MVSAARGLSRKTSTEIPMTQPPSLVTPLVTLDPRPGIACRAVRGGALALPAHALQTGAPATAGPGLPGSPDSLRDALALTPAQTALWQAARAAAREAHAHALELRARFIREEDSPMPPARPMRRRPSLRAGRSPRRPPARRARQGPPRRARPLDRL